MRGTRCTTRVRTLPGLLVTAALAVGCGDGGHGPDESEHVGRIGPIPAGLTGTLALATGEVITTSDRAYIESRIYAIDMGDPVARLVHRAQDVFVEGLTWAPDREHLVMQTFVPGRPGTNGRESIRELHQISVADAEDRLLFDRAGPEFHPAYSNGGRLAYFGGWSDDPSSGIYIDGGAVRPMPWGSGSGLAWTPDGGTLVYTGEPDGLARFTLTSGVTRLLAPEGGESIVEPAVAPDGRLAFMRFGGDREFQEIWTAGPTGSEPRQVTTGFADGNPAWTPGGMFLAFWRLDGPAPGIYVIEPDAGTPQRVVQVGNAGTGVMAWSR